MMPNAWRWKGVLSQFVAAMRPEPEPQARRIVAMQLHIVLPAKVGVVGLALYFLFSSGWLPSVTTTRGVVLETLQQYFLLYIACNAAATFVFVSWRRFPPGLFQWLVFVLGLLDGLFIAGLTFITTPSGFESTAYWMFPGLILLNALSIPLAMPQIVLNLVLSVFFLAAGFINSSIPETQFNLLVAPGRSAPRPSAVSSTNPHAEFRGTNLSGEFARRNRRPIRWDDSESMLNARDESATESWLLRLIVLWLLTASCYGVQVLLKRQRALMEESQEFDLRESQLRSAGRLAAEFAHQIKNPLAIINNAAFSIRRAIREGRSDIQSQIEIITEEVERSDRIVTQVMGYAQLAEGRVEKLNVTEELEAAIQQVFPSAAEFGIKIVREFEEGLPSLLMQRRQISDIFLNLLKNAREAIDGPGTVRVSARLHRDYSIEVVVADSGPGIPAGKLEQIFEAYYTTREKGTGLGLAIVKQKVELYGGKVWAESELGQGARFIVLFPIKAASRPVQPE
jgi:signal transduction histidine kinase